MLRQCAWCLRLIDCAGERLSTQPLPKLYEASHGMCSVCGTLWMEQVFNSLAPLAPSLCHEGLSDQGTTCVPQYSSSPNCTAGLSTRQQQGDAASMVVCEGTGSYSSHSVYPLPEEQQPVLEDDTSVSDLNQISHQRQP